jgi:hypothetical protein
MKIPSVVVVGPGMHIPMNMANKRIGKNTKPHNLIKMNKRRTHTSPVKRTKENSGATNPARVRAAKTKAYHASK